MSKNFSLDSSDEDTDLRRNEILFEKKVISKSDYELSLRSRNKCEQTHISSEADIVAADLDVLRLNQEMIELNMQHENQMEEYERSLIQSKQKLLNVLEQWMYNYVIIAPINGEISFVKYWSENQHVNNGDLIASIIPVKSDEIIGRLNVTSTNMGKIKKGQTVNVKLNSYPYLEYGTIKGVVRGISSVPDNDTFVVDVEFPKGLCTT